MKEREVGHKLSQVGNLTFYIHDFTKFIILASFQFY